MPGMTDEEWDHYQETGFLPTRPATVIEFRTRTRSCWRCRLHLRWPPWRKHWQCTFGPSMRRTDGHGH